MLQRAQVPWEVPNARTEPGATTTHRAKEKGRHMDPSQSQDEGSSVAVWNALPTKEEEHHAALWFGNAGHNKILQLAEAVASRTQSRASERLHLIAA